MLVTPRVLLCGKRDSPLGTWSSFLCSSSLIDIEIRAFSNHVPWIVIGICYFICPILLYIIRCILSAENKRRDLEPPDDTYDDVYLRQDNEDDKNVARKIDKVHITT